MLYKNLPLLFLLSSMLFRWDTREVPLQKCSLPCLAIPTEGTHRELGDGKPGFGGRQRAAAVAHTDAARAPVK